MNSTNRDPSKFQRVCMDDIPAMKIQKVSIFSYTTSTFLRAQWLGNLLEEPSKVYEKNDQLIQYNRQIG